MKQNFQCKGLALVFKLDFNLTATRLLGERPCRSCRVGLLVASTAPGLLYCPVKARLQGHGPDNVSVHISDEGHFKATINLCMVPLTVIPLLFFR